jgi:hypothetical protein
MATQKKVTDFAEGSIEECVLGLVKGRSSFYSSYDREMKDCINRLVDDGYLEFFSAKGGKKFRICSDVK